MASPLHYKYYITKEEVGMEGISMARVRVKGTAVFVTGRGADKVIDYLLNLPRLRDEDCEKQADSMKFPEYSEQGYARLRELGKL